MAASILSTFTKQVLPQNSIAENRGFLVAERITAAAYPRMVFHFCDFT